MILKCLQFVSSFLRGCVGDPVQAWEWGWPLLPMPVHSRPLRWGRPPSLAASDPGSQVRKELYRPLNPIFAVQRSQWNVPRAHSEGLQGGRDTGGGRDWVRPRNNKGQAILVLDMLIWLLRIRLGFFNWHRVVIFYIFPPRHILANKFLAAKRSSTRALVLCLSVCPWSKLNFSLFGQLMTTYDSLWQLMTAYDSLWQLMTTYDS